MRQSLRRVASIAALLLVAASAALGLTALAAPDGRSAEAEARAVTERFFQAMNERQYDAACALLSSEFYRRNRVKNPRLCAISLRIGMMHSESARFDIVGVTTDGDRATVSALADGAPGTVVLRKEHGRFKILALREA